MKKLTLLAGFFIHVINVRGQITSQKYYELVKKADSLYRAKDYKNSAFTYSAAFKEGGWKGLVPDRYNAACSWVLAGYPDSAFFNLQRIADFAKFSDARRVLADPDLNAMHEDIRWQPLIKKMQDNKDKAEEGLNRPLVHRLDSILEEDQKYRMQMEDVGKKSGWQSQEMKALWKAANHADSINLIKIKAILDTYGWLGPQEIGPQGNQALFLVIQHSDQKTQEKYLPMMREAVKNKKAEPGALALLEDRVALGQGKKQIYGSQIGHVNGNEYYVLPLEDPDNVDKRRAEVNLGPISEYVSHWKIKWDVEEYKKNEASNNTNDSIKISAVKLDNAESLSWIAENEKTKKTFVIEQFRWNKWIKVGEIEGAGSGTSMYSFHVALHYGENEFRISAERSVSKTIKYPSQLSKVSYKISAGSTEIQFSAETMFEITDPSGKLIKKGFVKTVAIADLPKGNYILNYDNDSARFTK